MKKNILTLFVASFVASSSYALNVSAPGQVSKGNVNNRADSAIIFTQANASIRLDGDFYGGWHAPRINITDTNYTYTEGDYVAIETTATGGFYVSTVSDPNFGKNISTGTGRTPDLYITGSGMVGVTETNTSGQTITTVTTNVFPGSRSKFHLDANTDFSTVDYVLKGNGYLTVSNTFKAKTLSVHAGSTLVMSVDNKGSYLDVRTPGALSPVGNGDNSIADVTINSGSAISTNIYGTFTQEAGTQFKTNQQVALFNGGNLNLHAANGFKTSYLFFRDSGSTVSVYAENAIRDYNGGNTVKMGIVGGKTGTLNLYANQTINILEFESETSVLNAHTNGYDFVLSTLQGAGTLNIIIDEGYSWKNNAIRITSASIDDVENILGSITVSDTAVDKSYWNLVDDGANGVYVNIIPEPSTYAIIFGALALGFVAYRRRK